MIDFKALAAAAVATGADQTKASVGGGDYAPPAAGPALVRFVSYVEIGKHAGSDKFPAVKDKVQLTFELVGKRHPPTVRDDGTVIPVRIAVVENLSLNEKAHFFKLFTRMNYKQDAQHIAQLLGEGFKAEVFHDEWKGSDGKPRVTASLKGAAGYSIAPPRKEDEDSETGWVDVQVPACLTPISLFLWGTADMQQWGSIFIDGTYPERKDEKTGRVTPAKSKNVHQNKIKSALNFQGSPMHDLLVAGGVPLDLPTAADFDEEEAGGATVAAGKPDSKVTSQTSTTTSHSEPDALSDII